jgi:hypothetical protein
VLSASAPPPSSRLEEDGSFVLQCGALVGLAGAAALVSTLPAMARVSAVVSGEAPVIRAWAALSATSLAPMGVAIVVLRRAREELRALAGPLPGLRLFGVGLWFALLVLTLTVFGAVLSATTHHHALAGVTYAFGAVALAVGLGLVCARIVAVLRGLVESVRLLAVVSLGLAVLGPAAYLGLRFLEAASSDPASAGAAAVVVDVLAFAVAAVLASADWRGGHKPLALVGPPVAVFVASLGLTTLRDPAVYQAIADHAPAFVLAAQLASGR